MSPILDIQNLSLRFETSSGTVNTLDKVSFSVRKGECVALVGESGSGKSVTGLAIMRLLPAASARLDGTILFNGTDLISLPLAAMSTYRGKRIAMIFQNAKSSLNPIRRIGDVLIDILQTHNPGLRRSEAKAKAIALLASIGINEPEQRLSAFPSELSGGMCQRIMIAAAFACDPDLVIADEPTSALDVTTQRLVMDLLMSACRMRGVSAIFITHDLALASEYCDRAVVLHAGQVLENGPADEVLSAPRHPYTRMLLASMPYGKKTAKDLHPMGGALPDLKRTDLPACRFAERCPSVQPLCISKPLPDTMIASGHQVRCQFPPGAARS